MRFAVCRCLRWLVRSSSKIRSMIPVNGPSFGRLGGALRRYPGGTENDSILRTVLRSTPNTREASRVLIPRHDTPAEPVRTTPPDTSPPPSSQSNPDRRLYAVTILVRRSRIDRPLQWGIIALPFSGIGPLHRIWQHKAGELSPPVQLIVGLNCILAMQGKIKDWVNYHAQHHRYSDQPGDPHNPAEGRFWAWIGWVLWRDPEDLKRPMVRWLQGNRAIRFADRHHVLLSLVIHVILPLTVYLVLALSGRGLVLAMLVHAAIVVARRVHFHATTIGVNVCGHIKVPKWVTWTLAILTGGEAFHAHHHAYPRSILHLPRKGILNRLIDYNGTVLLLLERLRLARNYHIAPQFA